MGKPKDNNSDQNRVKSDRGSWPLSDNGPRPTPPTNSMPKLEKPKK